VRGVSKTSRVGNVLEETDSLRSAERLGCLVALTGSIPLASSAWLTWASWSFADEDTSRTLLQLPLVPWLLAAAVLVIVGSAVAGLAGDSRAVELAGHVAVGVALFAALFLLGAEMLTALVPKLHLPGSAHRLAIGAAAGPGPWLALAAAIAIAVTAIGSLRERAGVLLADLTARGPSPLVAVVLFVASAPLLMMLLQETWLVAEVFDGELGVGGDALGYATWLALVAPLLLVVAAACICCGRFELGALIGAFAGWGANVSAGIAVVFAEALMRVSVRDAHATTSVWLTFALGFVPAGAATALLWSGGGRR
jgi:hypothetical protein